MTRNTRKPQCNKQHTNECTSVAMHIRSTRKVAGLHFTNYVRIHIMCLLATACRPVAFDDAAEDADGRCVERPLAWPCFFALANHRVAWSSVARRGAARRGAARRGVVWRGVVWCGVVRCGVVWCGVVWCGVVWFHVVSRRLASRHVVSFTAHHSARTLSPHYERCNLMI